MVFKALPACLAKICSQLAGFCVRPECLGISVSTRMGDKSCYFLLLPVFSVVAAITLLR